MDLSLIRKKLSELNTRLNAPDAFSDTKKYAQLSREYAKTKQIVDLGDEIENAKKERDSLNAELKATQDEELAGIAREELARLDVREQELSNALGELLHPADPNDDKNVIVEIRAGTGGDESTLFAAELFRMYSRYAEQHGWKCDLASTNRTGLGGYKEVIFSIEGERVYRMLKYEMGVHRVQRVPETEKSGRVHTSAATVAVLPEAEEVDIELKPQDLRIDTFMAGGHGGQSVNTTYSAVRITRLPTGLVVACQDERSQLQNKAKALLILRSRLLAMEQEKKTRERAESRKSQVGTGDRSEKIRTYNFPQDRVTDHRIKESFHGIDRIMNGDLDPMILVLQAAEKQHHANRQNDN